jgi:hypothetical protein
MTANYPGLVSSSNMENKRHRVSKGQLKMDNPKKLATHGTIRRRKTKQNGCLFVHLLSVLCCPIMCLYVLSSMLWCPLQFPHENDVRLSLPQFFWVDRVLFAYIVVYNKYCVVFLLCFSSSYCAMCCQFLK